MISSLYGPIRNLRPDQAVIDIGGIGLSVTITPTTSARLSIGGDTQFFTSLVVREDSLTLFGFLDEASRTLFELVQTVTGIGPRVAMSILGVLSPDDLAFAVAQENISAIERVPGIGRKGAQRIILELKGKLDTIATSRTVPMHLPPWREQLSSALMGLGFNAKEADGSINHLVTQLRNEEQDPAEVELGELLKRALQGGHS